MAAGTKMVDNVFRKNGECRAGWRTAQTAAMPMHAQKLRKIATPPRRGRGLECMWRSCVGTATRPWDVAKSRTYLVRTNADSRPAKNSPRQIRVNYATSTHRRLLERHLYCKYGSENFLPIVNAMIPGKDQGSTVAVPEWDFQ